MSERESEEKVLAVLTQTDVDNAIHALEEMETIAGWEVRDTIEKLHALTQSTQDDYRLK